MISLIFGCSGSGKTQYMIKKIRESVASFRRTYLLVPEQQVFVAEKMLGDLPPEAGLYFEVISFSRLCDIVFDKFGGKNYTSVSGGLKNLIMWQSIKDISPVLSEYGRTKPDAKFSALMMSTYDELKANSVTIERLEEISRSEDFGNISEKLSDICLIMSSFKINLGKTLGEGAVACEDKLERLEDCLLHNDFFEGSDVFIDSFTDFTGIEHEIISRIMHQADNLWISVYSKERGYRAPHTLSVSDTVRRLTRSARESGRDFEDVTLNGNTRTESLQLKLLEKHLWDFSAKKETLPEVPKEQSYHIEMISCNNEYDETECAALKILEERGRGTKYSEIAVILRNPEERSGIIDAVFSKYNIPYFLSEKTGLLNTPAARFVLSSLRCISKNYRLDDVLTLLKSGLCGVSNTDADMFEEYCLTWDIHGSTFNMPVWNMNPNGFTTDTNERSCEILSAANRVREIIITPLEKLKVKFRNCGNTAALCRALYEYTEHHALSQRLSDLAELELSLGNTKEAGEILRVYDNLLSTLSQICAVLNDTTLTTDEFITALEIMLSGTDIASVPSIGEMVTIGSAATLRVENIKTAIVMEMCEGIFPSLPKEAGLISETDKEKLEEVGLIFKSRRNRLMSDELFYVYRAFSKPSEKLIVTTYKSSISGSAKSPSTPWRRLRTLFDIPIEEFDIKGIRKLAKSQKQAASDFEISERVAEKFELPDTCERIPQEVIRTVIGDTLRLSKSQINTFVLCPMHYWSKTILSLRECQRAEINTSSSGTLVHFVLEKLLSEVVGSDGKLPHLNSQRILELTDKWVNNYIDLTGCIRTPDLMYSFSKLRNLAYIMVKNTFDEFEHSAFRIHSFEKKINNYSKDALHPLEIRLEGIENRPRIILGGIADRIDTYKDGEKTYVRVVDYKTGNVSFKEEYVADGSDIQLPAYLFSVTSEQNKGFFTDKGDVLPGASIYMSAVDTKGKIEICRSGMILNEDKFLYASNDEMNYRFISNSAASSKKNQPCPELLDSGQINYIKQVLEERVIQTGSDIYSGISSRCPSSEACKYCPIKMSCPVAVKSKY